MTFSIVVLISGNGTNLQALIDATKTSTLNATITLVVSNKTSAFGLTRAIKAGIPTLVLTLKEYIDIGKSRVDYDIALAKKIKEQNPDLIVLAGWMHILSKEFINYFPNNIINIHPALPGQFDGAHAIERAFEAFQRGEITETGVMVHKVIPEVDKGEPLLIEHVPILKSDTLEDLETRIHSVEHRLIVQAAIKFLELI
ncbi:8976_t:CDS:1 [Ambispora gerdemannii]|uniref:phosphoribosylglycinamide formyltransferase 1 n=1 Tax=Ambispora gerdemannii TaxID=144530 RepID=A0A9N8VUT2_9GLOM|nr:8976_t:CDS:1 [Ambispora gerdemannii]